MLGHTTNTRKAYRNLIKQNRCGKEADLRDEIVKFVEKEFQTKRTTREFYWYEHVFCHPLDVSLGCGSNFGERFMFFFCQNVFLAKPKADSAQRIGVELLNCSLSNLFNFGYLSDFKIVSSSQKGIISTFTKKA
jgi:hypothetical protein